MTFLERLKELCSKKGISLAQLERDVEISRGAAYKWSKSSPSKEILVKLSEYFNVSIDYLTKGEYEPNAEVIKLNDVARLPIYGRIPAGIPKEAIQEVEGFIEVPAYMSEGYIVLKVIGDSMYPKYLDGDVVIIKERPDCESGQDCAVRINDNDVTLKKVIKMEDGLMLQPLNPEYPPQFFSYSDELCPVYILGVVVEIRRKV